MSISDLQAQIDNLTLRVRVLELEVRRTAEAAPAVPLASSSAPEVQAAERLVVARLSGDFFVRCLEGTNQDQARVASGCRKGSTCLSGITRTTSSVGLSVCTPDSVISNRLSR